jgi:hypothetical protein
MRLPDHTSLSRQHALQVVQKHFSDHAAVLDLYDGTNQGPHDALTAVDVLALIRRALTAR